jgi:hypothetical protein
MRQVDRFVLENAWEAMPVELGEIIAGYVPESSLGCVSGRMQLDTNDYFDGFSIDKYADKRLIPRPTKSEARKICGTVKYSYGADFDEEAEEEFGRDMRYIMIGKNGKAVLVDGEWAYVVELLRGNTMISFGIKLVDEGEFRQIPIFGGLTTADRATILLDVRGDRMVSGTCLSLYKADPPRSLPDWNDTLTRMLGGKQLEWGIKMVPNTVSIVQSYGDGVIVCTKSILALAGSVTDSVDSINPECVVFAKGSHRIRIEAPRLV